MIQWPCNGQADQKFVLEDVGDGYYRFRAQHSGQCLDVYAWSIANGAPLIQWYCHDGANQQFRLTDRPGGVSLTPRHSQATIAVTAGSPLPGTPAIQWRYTGVPDQHFQLR